MAAAVLMVFGIQHSFLTLTVPCYLLLYLVLINEHVFLVLLSVNLYIEKGREKSYESRRQVPRRCCKETEGFEGIYIVYEIEYQKHS